MVDPASPRISVLLTCFNNLSYLKQSIKALQDQSFQNFELLALDDCSTDGTREWLKVIAMDFPNMRLYFHEKNLGTYGNLNFGIEHAKGEWLAIYNDDDLWMSNKLQVQMEVADRNPEIALIHTSGWFINEKNERVDGAPLGFPFPFCNNGMIMPELIYHNKIITSSAVFRADAVKSVGLFDAGFYGCGDWHMWLRISEKFPVYRCSEELTLYRVHELQACRDDEKMQQDDVAIRTWIASNTSAMLASQPDNKELRLSLAHNLACLGTGHLWMGEKVQSRIAYVSALKMNPMRLKTWLRLLLTILPVKNFRQLR